MSANPRTLLRGACGLLGDELKFDGQPLDILVEGGRITAIEPAGRVRVQQNTTADQRDHQYPTKPIADAFP